MITQFSTWGVIVGAGIFLIGLVVFLLSLRVFRGTEVSKRLQDFVVDDGTHGRLVSAVLILPEDIKGSLFSRTVIPFFRRIVGSIGRLVNKTSLSELDRKLSVAGNPFNLRAVEFNGIRLVCFMGGLLVALMIIIPQHGKNLLLVIGGILFFVLITILPDGLLNRAVRTAQDNVRTGLPDMLDMLSVCAFAGLGFDQSLQRVSEYWQTTLGSEIRRLVQEIELGISRADALRNMSNRLGVPELSTFVAVIIQAENLGMRTADVLHAQAEQMRIVRQLRAKELANQLPAKMIVPLALLILPALMAVLFAPMIPALLALLSF
jgi:tight adherence protein C